MSASPPASSSAASCVRFVGVRGETVWKGMRCESCGVKRAQHADPPDGAPEPLTPANWTVSTQRDDFCIGRIRAPAFDSLQYYQHVGGSGVGSAGVFIVQTRESGVMVIKGGDHLMHEVYAQRLYAAAAKHIASSLGTPVAPFRVPDVVVLVRGSKSFDALSVAMERVRRVRDEGTEVDVARIHRLIQYKRLMLMEFAIGTNLDRLSPAELASLFDTGGGSASSSHSSASSVPPRGWPPLRSLGAMLLLDLIVNNWDRIPCPWPNGGNAGNVMFRTRGHRTAEPGSSAAASDDSGGGGIGVGGGGGDNDDDGDDGEADVVLIDQTVTVINPRRASILLASAPGSAASSPTAAAGGAGVKAGGRSSVTHSRAGSLVAPPGSNERLDAYVGRARRHTAAVVSTALRTLDGGGDGGGGDKPAHALEAARAFLATNLLCDVGERGLASLTAGYVAALAACVSGPARRRRLLALLRGLDAAVARGGARVSADEATMTQGAGLDAVIAAVNLEVDDAARGLDAQEGDSDGADAETEADARECSDFCLRVLASVSEGVDDAFAAEDGRRRPSSTAGGNDCSDT